MKATDAKTAQAGTTAQTMTAVVQETYGEADVLHVAQVARPQPADDEVLVRVEAAGVDRGVWHLMTGLPYPVRLMGYGLRRPSNPIRGREVAGRVEAVGAGVTAFKPGDEVFGIGEGTFAEYVCAAAGKLAPKPARLSFVQASALPVSGLTALQAVRDFAQVKAGQSVLVLGASGGVGSFAVQIAKAYGAHVTGVCSTAKLDLVRSLGADDVLDYTSADVTDGARTYDVVIDTGGSRPLRHLRRALTPDGTLVVVGGENGGKWLGGSDRLLRAPAMNLFVSQRLKTVMAKESGQDLVVLAGLAESGAITPAVDRTFPLAEAADALRHLSEGRARGKVVVEVRPRTQP